MDITLIVALITALAAIIAPVLTALITQHGEYRLKSLELFFNAKSKAYLELLDATSNFPKFPEESKIIELYALLNRAFLLSTENTRSKLSLYVKLLIESSADSELLTLAYQDAVLAMQNELKDYCK